MNQAAAPSALTRRLRAGCKARALPHLPALVAIVALAALVHAPARAQEVQVPIDRSGRLQRVDSQLEKRLGMFTGRYPGFTEARLFRAADSTFVLEVTMARGAQLLRERVPLSAAGADSLRDQVSIRLAEKAPEAALNQEGRALLVSMTTLLGLGFYGWALPYSAEVDNGETAVGIYLLTAGGSFFLPFALTSQQTVTNGMTDLTLYGTTRGIPHGIVAYQLFAGKKGESAAKVGAALAGSVVEGVGGYLWARGSGLKAGSTTTIGTLGDFGLLEGWGAATLADYYDDGRYGPASATLLVGSAAGLAAGGVLASRRDYSYGDARIMRDGMLLTSVVSLMIVDWFNPGDNTYVAAAMIGGAAGLGIGDRMVRGAAFTPGQSWLVTVGMVAGGAMGLGIGYLATHNSSDNGTVLLTSGTLGAVLGYAGTYGSFLQSARLARMGASSWQVEVSPLGLVAARTLGARGRDAGAVADLPLVRVTVRF